MQLEHFCCNRIALNLLCDLANISYKKARIERAFLYDNKISAAQSQADK